VRRVCLCVYLIANSVTCIILKTAVREISMMKLNVKVFRSDYINVILLYFVTCVKQGLKLSFSLS